MAVDFGLALTFGPPEGAPPQVWMDELDTVLPVLEGHFASLWMTDHFFWGMKPTYEAWTAMTYLLARYPKWQVGPMVLGQSYRNPALLAKMAATLQIMSGGRYIMGIGAGWKEDEYRAFDYEYPTAIKRIEQMDDAIEIMRRLWTEPDPVTFHGKHYKVVNAYCQPKPQPIPIVIGGRGDRMLLSIARHADWWNLSDVPIEVYKERLNRLRQRCDEVGRDINSLRLTWFGRIVLGDNEADALKLGLEAAPSRGEKSYTRDNAFVGTPEMVTEQMQQFVAEAGVSYFMVDVINIADADVQKTVLEEIVPKVKAVMPVITD